ncbi:MULTISPECIES: tetratricopeptide repeat protein [Prevotella]|nr:tetratricopeptide repeat protein [Prevotella brunnea]
MKHWIILMLLSASISAGAQNHARRDSLRMLQEQLDQAPDNIDLRLQCAGWKVLLEQWESAKNDYDQVLRKDPDNVSALFYRAYVNERLGRYNFARQDYHNLLRQAPGNFEAQLGLALLNQKDQHYTEALDGINRLVEQYPDNAVAYAARAGIEAERKMYLLAEYDFTQAILRDPENNEYVLQRIDVYLLQDKRDQAKRDLDRLVRKGMSKPALQEFYDRLKQRRTSHAKH